MGKIKFFIPPNTNTNYFNHIFKVGLSEHPDCEIVLKEQDCDFVIVDNESYKNKLSTSKDKRIHICYSDNQGFIEEYKKYSKFIFKRSIVIKDNKLSLINLGSNVFHSSYCIKKEALNWQIKPLSERKFDVSVLFRPGMISGRGRGSVAAYIKEKLNGYNIFVGVKGKCGAIGRQTIQIPYYEQILNSKIVVTCNPDGWEGDWRLFEALSCSPLVIVDEMLTPLYNRLDHEKHLVYYSKQNKEDLKNKIIFYLNNINKAQTIASNGYNHARQHYTPTGIINQMLKNLNLIN